MNRAGPRRGPDEGDPSPRGGTITPTRPASACLLVHILAHLPNLPGAACIEHRDVSAPDFFQLSAEQSTVMTDRALRERHTHMTQADPA